MHNSVAYGRPKNITRRQRCHRGHNHKTEQKVGKGKPLTTSRGKVLEFLGRTFTLVGLHTEGEIKNIHV